MSGKDITTRDIFMKLSAEDFVGLGAEDIAYIKPTTSKLGEGFRVCSGSGEMLANKTSFAGALETADFHGRTVFTLH
jgi:hypothetical protein